MAERDGLLWIQVRYRNGVAEGCRRGRGYTVGVLVQANHGGVRNCASPGFQSAARFPTGTARRGGDAPEQGSIIIVIATDAPMLPHQLSGSRVAHRWGWRAPGATSGNGSGDIFIAFSTANAGRPAVKSVATVSMLSNERISALFSATVDATEEAIVNALAAGETMVGVSGHRVESLPHDRLRQLMRSR